MGRFSDERWYRLPIVWLGATILAASVIGCIAMILLAARLPDESIVVDSERLQQMPAARTPEPAQ